MPVAVRPTCTVTSDELRPPAPTDAVTVSRARPRVRALVAVLAVLMVVVVVLWSAQRRLTYFPAGTPPPVAQVLPGGTEVVVTTDDGLDLQAWWVPGGTTAVMVLPGNGGNRAGRAPLATALGELGLSVLLVDYRGYGGNPGTPSQEGLLADARAAAGWLRARQDIDDIVYFGESLGGAVAVGLARERSPAALILRSPFTSLVDVARTHYGPVPRWLLRDRYPALEWIGEVSSPLLVVASQADEIVPHALSRRLFEAADDPRTLATVPDAGHNDPDLLGGEVMVEAVATFLGSLGLLPER